MEGRYTVTEVAKATGLIRQCVSYRAERLGIDGSNGFSYQDIQAILNYKSQNKRKSRPAAVTELRKKLRNDGFEYKVKL